MSDLFLPIDLLIIIITMCPVHDISKLVRISRAWSLIFQIPLIWKNLLKIHFDLIDNANPYLTFRSEWLKISDKFERGINCVLSNEFRTVKSYHRYDYQWNKVILGKNIFCAGKKTWKLKINKTIGSMIILGVAPIHIEISMYDVSETCGYYLYTSDGTLWSGSPFNYKSKSYHEMRIKNGEIIEIELDLDKRTLSYTYLGKRLGIAYSNFPKLSYQLCISFYNNNDEIELIR